MYEQRNFVLENDDVHSIVKDMTDRIVANVVEANVNHANHEDTIDAAGVIQGLGMLGLAEDAIKPEELRGMDSGQASTYCADKIFNSYEEKIAPIKDQFLPFEKTIVLRNMDRNWIEHIDMMDKLRSGIHLRSYAQNNPLQAYVSEGYEMFEEMMQRIAREVVFFALKVEIQPREEQQESA